MAQAMTRESSFPVAARARLNVQAAGYGLGLAITSDIAALFNAELQIQRGNDGCGTRAVVTFPAIGPVRGTSLDAR
jgi:signal transduction histidine kinase